MENSNSSNRFDGVTVMDANEVKAFFATLREQPRSLTNLKLTFEYLKDRLTPSGRVAFEKELSKLLQTDTVLPQSVPELLDGEYGLVIHGDYEGLATLHCDAGKYWITLPFAPAVVFDVDVDGTFECKNPKAMGKLDVKDGYLMLELQVTVDVNGKPVRRTCNAIGKVTGGRA